MSLFFSVRSNKGKVRQKNEDNFFADGAMLLPDYRDRPFSFDAVADAPVLLAVCDGMGGEESGEIASAAAVKKMAEMEDVIKKSISENPIHAVQTYADTVDSELKECGKRMGTTMAMALITKKAVRCFNIGDSRIYYLKHGKLTQLTHDHTAAAKNAQIYNTDLDKARANKDGNKLTRCIGIGSDTTVEEYAEIHGKCRLMICSDGLTDMVPVTDIKKILTDCAQTSDAAEQLVRSALNNGGKDNVTVIVADLHIRRPNGFISRIMKRR